MLQRKVLALLSIFIIIQAIYLYTTYSILLSQPSIIQGHVLAEGTASFQQNGTAAMILTDELIDFGTGYYNSSCSDDFARITSNTSKVCWINLTPYMTVEDTNTIENTGSIPLNLSVSIQNISHAEAFFCQPAAQCNATNSSRIRIASINQESGSCSFGLTTDFENVANDTAVLTVGICDLFAFIDTSDTIKTYVEFQVPKDARGGNKTLVLEYQAVAV